MLKESKIYYPPETPQEKNAAKAVEREAARKREREPRLIKPEDLEATIADAKKKENRWSSVKRGEFKDWWLGKNGGEGGKKLANWVFKQLVIYRDLLEDYQQGKISVKQLEIKGQPDFFQAVEPSLRQLIWGASRYKGQEHIGQYFREEWGPEYLKDVSKEEKDAVNENIVKKVWKIYQKYTDDIDGKV